MSHKLLDIGTVLGADAYYYVKMRAFHDKVLEDAAKGDPLAQEYADMFNRFYAITMKVTGYKDGPECET